MVSNWELINFFWILFGVRKVDVFIKVDVIVLWGDFLMYLKFKSYVVCIVKWDWDLYFDDCFVSCWFNKFNCWFLYFLRYLLIEYWRVLICVLVCFKVRGRELSLWISLFNVIFCFIILLILVWVIRNFLVLFFGKL